MARLQKYPGKGKDVGKTFYRLQPYLPDGRRVTIRLGTGQKRAEKAVKAIEDLIESSKEKVELNASTKAWTEKADAKLLSSLHDFGLINAESIAKSESWTLEKLTANYGSSHKKCPTDVVRNLHRAINYCDERRNASY